MLAVPTTFEGTTWPVRVTEHGAGTFHNNRVLKAGDLIDLPVAEAGARERRGEVTFTTFVRALKPSVSAAGGIVLDVGGIAPMAPDRAAQLAREGVVAILPDGWVPPEPEPAER